MRRVTLSITLDYPDWVSDDVVKVHLSQVWGMPFWLPDQREAAKKSIKYDSFESREIPA